MSEDEGQDVTSNIERKSDENDNDSNNPEPAKLPPELSVSLEHDTSEKTILKDIIEKFEKR